MENKPFLMRDPLLMEEAIFMKDDDDFSTDSWERVSNDDFVHIPATMVSRPTSPPSPATSTGESATYIIEDETEDTIRPLNQLDSPPFLVSYLIVMVIVSYLPRSVSSFCGILI